VGVDLGLRMKDITQALWGTRVWLSTVRDLNKKIYGRIEEWHNAAIEGIQAFLCVEIFH